MEEAKTYEGVPLLGFEGERYRQVRYVSGNYKSVLDIPVKGFKTPIQVYRWGGPIEGYNVFFPRSGEKYATTMSQQAYTPFEVKMLVRAFIDEHVEELK